MVTSHDCSSSSSRSTVKFLCSYDGKFLPRYPDRRLRYVGGETRVLTVDRSTAFSELQVKMEELCGWSTVSLRCQLPLEDLDTLVSVTSGEDLANLVEEYDVANRDRFRMLKIRAFLHRPLSTTTTTTASKNVVKKANCSSVVGHQRRPFHRRRCVYRWSVPPRTQLSVSPLQGYRI